MSTSYGLIIELSMNEKLQKYRMILSQHISYLYKWLVYLLICLLLLCLFFSGKFLNMCKSRTTTYSLWQPGPPGLAFYGSGSACLTSWVGMVNAGWLCSMRSEISCKWNLSFFKAVLPKRQYYYLGSPVFRISSLFSYFCLFRKAILQNVLKLRFSNFKHIFLRTQFSLITTFCPLVMVICLSWNLSPKLSHESF